MSRSIHQNEELKAQLTSRMGDLSFRQEESKIEEIPIQSDRSQDFSILSMGDARVNPEELLRMQQGQRVPQIPLQKAVDAGMGTDPRESHEKMSSAVVDTESREMQSEGVAKSDKLCESKPHMSDKGLGINMIKGEMQIEEAPELPLPKPAYDGPYNEEVKINMVKGEMEVESTEKVKQRNLENDTGIKLIKGKGMRAGRPGPRNRYERTLEIIREEIARRVPVIFKEMMDRQKLPKASPVVRQAHLGIMCDGCGIKPIVGSRYKCTVRESFDLCERCEASTDQPYALLKIKKPELAPKSLTVVQEQTDEIPEAKPINFVDRDNYMRMDVDAVPPPKKGGVWERAKKSSAAGVPAVKTFKCRYVKENPDGEQVLAPGTTFKKTYTLRNDGDEAWPEGSTLCFVGGDNLSFQHYTVGRVEPHEETVFTIEFTAPEEEGRYTSYLRMCERMGEARFGHRFWCSVVTKKPEEKPALFQELLVVPQEGEPVEAMQDSSAFNEPAEEDLNPLQKDARFYDLAPEIQVQALNLWNMGATDNPEKVLALLNKHNNNVAAVANDLFMSQHH